MVLSVSVSSPSVPLLGSVPGDKVIKGVTTGLPEIV